MVARNECWSRHRRWALSERRSQRHSTRDWDIINERIVYNDGLVVVEALVGKLIVVLEDNPFPGEKKRVLDIAQELFPGARVVLYPKVSLSGEQLWLEIFELGDIEHRERLRFPVKDTERNIQEIEDTLYAQIREDNTMLASTVPVILKVKSTSREYANIRNQLQKRGWTWSQRRENGVKVKIVYAPRN